MSVNIRYPNITGSTDKEQLTQVKSYLHQLVDQLNYAIPNMGTGEGTTQASTSYEVQGGEMSYYELRSLIIQELQQVEALFEKLSQKMESEYVKDEEIPEAIEEALTEAKNSGEFDGPPGPEGPQGIPGADGFSPVVTVTMISGGHRVTITDAEGTNTFDVMDGTGGGGEGGVSPRITVDEIEGGHRVTITDVDGTKTVDVMDGYTPVKGVDYFTEAEKLEIAQQASQLSGLRFELDGGTILH